MSRIKMIGERLILDVVNPIYKTKLIPIKDNRGRLVKDDIGRTIKEEQDIFVKNIKVPTGFDKEAIKITGGTLNKKGELSKTQCVVYDKYTGRFYTVAHTQAEVEKAIEIPNDFVPIGFLAHLQQNNKPSNKR